MKLAWVDPRDIGQAALGISMAAKEGFGRSFLSLEKAGSMLSSRGRANLKVISAALGEIEEIFGLRESNPGALNEGHYGILKKLSSWLSQIKEKQGLEDQWDQPPYDPGGK